MNTYADLQILNAWCYQDESVEMNLYPSPLDQEPEMRSDRDSVGRLAELGNDMPRPHGGRDLRIQCC